jgi:thiosulfate/3-mercaptopyruvate sulfurtransferase
MGRHGVGEGTRVVLYSAATPMWASRVWWMLRVAGFDAAAVLDGGLDKWLAEGRPVEAGRARYPEARFVARPRPELLRDKTGVLDRLGDGRALLVNTLSPADFRGLEASRYGRPGRIPGSVNLPYADLIEADSHAFIDEDEAARRLEAFGIDDDREILCYCGGGISATMALLMLHRLGFEHLSLYDGSLGEWARDAALPMERG